MENHPLTNKNDDENKTLKYSSKTAPKITKKWHQTVFPVLDSFKNYDLGKLLGDISGGATVCALRVPQAMAYGLLAGLTPVNGLYCDLVAPWLYAIFGSSPQISVGTFSIIAIMTSISMGKVSDQYCLVDVANATDVTSNSTEIDPQMPCKVAIRAFQNEL